MLAQRDVILTAAEVELGHAADLGGVEDTPRASPVAGELSCMGHYLQEVRRFALLSPAREVALAQHIQDGSWQWRDALLQHLLHVPLLLAYRARLRRGVMPIAALCVPEPAPPLVDLVARLDRVQRLRCQMRQLVRRHGGRRVQGDAAETVAAWRAEMQALLAAWTWQPAFLSQAWTRFDTAMAVASLARQRRQVARYLATLGYSLGELRALWRMLHRLSTSVERAKQEMITGNLRLVISVARAFSHLGLPLPDLIQEGNIGLMHAVDKFDYRRNLKFSTYAVWWIKHAMRRVVVAQSALIYIPEYMYFSAREVSRSQSALAVALGHPPTAVEIAQHLARPVERVERSLMPVFASVSLDQPLAAADTRTLNALLADPHASTSHEALVQQDLMAHLHRALANLAPRDAEVMRRRFGLHGTPSESLRQIGDALHLSRERVRQIEAAALAKLRRRSATLRVFLEP